MTDFLVVGFPKSGTRTLHTAFREAHKRSAHWVVREGFCGQIIYQDFRAGKDPLERLRRFHCIAQADVCLPDQVRHGESLNFWPQLDFDLISAIEEFNPELKFILNRRDVANLIRSINGWASLRNRITKSEIIGLPAGKGRTDAELRAWIEGHYAACAAHFADRPNYLDFDIADPDAHAKVEQFVGVELPWWGVANASREREGSESEPSK